MSTQPALKRVLFIDRDGTIIKEPPSDYQVDSLEKLEFYPGAITALNRIVKDLDFELVMVTNQDGLGTSSFPEETFWPAQNRMLNTLEGESIKFANIHIDKSFPEDNAPTRKPGTAMLSEYMNGHYDLQNSFVIGDRITDIELAKNLGCKGIFLKSKAEAEEELNKQNLKEYCALYSEEWEEIVSFLFVKERTASVERNTSETKIRINLNLDGTGKCNIHTGLSFFDHMLEQIGRHSGCDLDIRVDGDLHVDEHHTIEDTALALGEAFKKALGDKRGIERYGFSLPMDDCMAHVALDFGGRPWLVWKTKFKREKVGDLPTEMFMHFFKSFSDAAAANLYIKAKGKNEHHKIEAIFKGLARALKAAINKDYLNNQLPSTKGSL
ncbi:bifunctional histidinol-phosphatase/imidazoleglycerol-phosphate dehydratase HisB [Marinilabilia salmonicolor]|jgi:imidazoleglycerol-phosphate dehydratase/histidinol-phosphatase|uniref:Histidine biosynthesis bifunctional protein HisB n=1 Tax=Marinilabilia salmonicolor TaxID=989 RepID=A0A2T0XT29_9BACT|nr:bifunctional histidinol-phosphatase/imidazoleglycerol-phosphate dehydratase HisB [Marinilabilia salmonicolor]PRZ02103.1 imidazoleglycerol-phosphate dehydratase [Marinilabilia salmonicolor]RCW36058.1 imidazoleglycerol-phosphate dehydratase [Marinilabilia salmonicolor]